MIADANRRNGRVKPKYKVRAAGLKGVAVGVFQRKAKEEKREGEDEMEWDE